MNDFIFTLFYLAIGLGLFERYSERLSFNEGRAMRWAFAGAAVSAPLMILVTKYVLGGGDMFWYFRTGNQLIDLLMTNPGRWGAEIFKLSTRLTAQFPFWVHGAGGGTSTGAMFGIGTWIMLICGKSTYATCMLISLLNFASRVAFYHAMRPLFHERHRVILVFVCVGVPSQVFWTAGLLKEAVAMIGLGWAMLGVSWVARHGMLLRGGVLIFLGCVPSYMVKPYLLFPFVIAMGVWIATERLVSQSEDGRLRINPLYLVVGVLVSIAAVTILGTLFPQYSVGQLGDEFETIQTAGTNVGGDTNYQILAPPEYDGPPSLTRQILMAPLGLLFALTRPVFFEVRSLQLLVNSIETTAFTFFFLRMFVVNGAARVWATIMRTPVLLVCIAYVGVFGAAVGLASTNVGSLSRYRVPMMGMYALIIFGLPALMEQAAAAKQPAVDAETEEAPSNPTPRGVRARRGRSRLSPAVREEMRRRRTGRAGQGTSRAATRPATQ